MGPPRQLPPAGSGSGSGRGPFGQKAYKAALIVCIVLVVSGPLLLLTDSAGLRAVGTSFLALGGVGLLTSGAGMLAERLLHRQPPPPADVRKRNGHSRHPPNI